jgi:CubicO group peptidase (beta-lactamase class C family)/phage terminase large subunit-like protein
MTQFFNRNIPEECHQQMKAFAAAGDSAAWLAFAPGGGSRFSIVTAKGAFFNRNIPDECHSKMKELSTGGNRVVCVAFPPQGGNSWSIVTSNGAFFNRNIPQECHDKMVELSTGGTHILCVAFPPQGGNSWSLVTNKGTFFNRNIPQECHDKMLAMSSASTKLVCVAFPPQGGNSWSVLADNGAFFNRNIPADCHAKMQEMSAVYGALKLLAFDNTDGNGWSVSAQVTNIVCDSKYCVTIGDVYDNIAAQLDGKVVGYACAVGRSLSYHSYGKARTAANAPAQDFVSTTKIPVASVSKMVTALAAIRVLAQHNVSLDSTIAGHLPSDWKLDPSVASITFRELMSHRSGIKDYGNVNQDYASLKKFFTQTVDKTKNTQCTGPSVVNPADPINPNNKNPCYSNYNFSIFRIMLPIIDGFVDDPAHRAEKLAAAYVKLVQKNVFEPVGAIGVDSKPPSSGAQATAYAYSYQFPGTSSGFDWGDDTAQVGAAGWYLAVEDIAKVMQSLNNGDGRVLTPAQFAEMESSSLGWDAQKDSDGYRWLEKNGGWGANGTTISTSVAFFGPGVLGVLFMNSDVSGAPTLGAATVLHDAYKKAMRAKS